MKILYGKHSRERDESGGIAPKGGYTIMAVEHDDGSITVGTSFCSDNDNFCRRVGRTIAVGRAVQAKVHGRRFGFPEQADSPLAVYTVSQRLPTWLRQKMLEAKP